MSQNQLSSKTIGSTFEKKAANIEVNTAGRKSVKHTVDTNHPVYKTKILVVNPIQTETDYLDAAKTKISKITEILPLSIPRSIVAILFTLIVIPVIFSPGIFMPDFLAAAGGGASVTQFRFPEAVFKNLNFDNRDILKPQIDHLISSYNKRLKHYCPESEISKLIASRIITAEYIWMNATDDLFLDYMMAQIASVKIKPYFSYARDRKTPSRVASLGRWATETERIDYERKLAEFMQKYPDVYEKANFDRLEKINDLITEAVMTHTYIVNETKTVVIETEKKPAKKVKKYRRKAKAKKSEPKKEAGASKSEEKAAAPKEEKPAEQPAAAAEPVPAPAPAPEPAVTPAPEPAPAPAAEPEKPKEDPKNKSKAKPKQDKKAGRADNKATPAPAPAPEPAPAAAEPLPAPAPAPDAQPPADTNAMTPPPAPEPAPEQPATPSGN